MDDATDRDRAELDRFTADLADVEIAMACLDRDSPDLCASCIAAEADGTLEQRQALLACVESKRSLPTR